VCHKFFHIVTVMKRKVSVDSGQFGDTCLYSVSVTRQRIWRVALKHVELMQTRPALCVQCNCILQGMTGLFMKRMYRISGLIRNVPRPSPVKLAFNVCRLVCWPKEIFPLSAFCRVCRRLYLIYLLFI